MRDFNRGGGGGGSRGGYGGNRGGGGGRSFGGGGGRGFGGPREMHPAVCSNCGKDCEVPFRPSGEKPVFCSDCFRKDSGDSRPRGGDRFNRDDRGDRAPQKQGPNYQAQFDALNQKLDKILNLISIPEKPKAKVEPVVAKPKKKAVAAKK